MYFLSIDMWEILWTKASSGLMANLYVTFPIFCMISNGPTYLGHNFSFLPTQWRLGDYCCRRILSTIVACSNSHQNLWDMLVACLLEYGLSISLMVNDNTKFNCIPNTFCTYFQKCEVKRLAQSDMIKRGTPWSLTMFVTYNSIKFSTKNVALIGKKQANLVNQSTTTQIAS